MFCYETLGNEILFDLRLQFAVSQSSLFQFILQDTLPFPYDLERIIDDWILMGFLVGNDFIPHLPNLHINHVSKD